MIQVRQGKQMPVKLITVFLVARLAQSNQVSDGGFTAAGEWDHVMHRQFNTIYLTFATAQTPMAISFQNLLSGQRGASPCRPVAVREFYVPE